jgi:hypothetical protein
MISAMTAQSFTVLVPLLVFAAVGIVQLRRRNALRATQSAPLGITADGTIAVSVRGLYLRRAGIFGGDANNSVNPRFTIGPDGIGYRVFRQSRLSFAAIDHVEVRRRLGSVHLLFLNSSDPRLLSVNVGDRDTARQVLIALPSSVPLTPEAAIIRDGTADAGTIGLSLYNGRFA